MSREAVIDRAQTSSVSGSLELTVLMPCLNEAETVGACVQKALDYLRRSGILGEVLVADNGSRDGSQDIARRFGARVVDVPVKGYGAAIRAGVEASRGRWVVIGDADDSYDFSSLDAFLSELRRGSDVVIGNRFRGGIEPGAMPWLHRYVGNPVLSWIGRVFYHVPMGDFHCGLRAIDRQKCLDLRLRSDGMEFASEMVVLASLHGYTLSEVPTKLYRDGRSRAPHLRTWSDGMRHLRFLLLFSPRWLFLVPGLVLTLLGVIGEALLALDTPTFAGGSVRLTVNTMIVAMLAIALGIQAISFAAFSKLYAASRELLPMDRKTLWFKNTVTLGRCLVGAVLIFLLGIGGLVASFLVWQSHGFGQLDNAVALRGVIPSATACVIGGIGVLDAFFLGVLTLEK